ncbi:E3 ubiquitin-protein ligase FANCL-like [Telopea speciosissima]|uniref:E3 ubiquitin-protein ligase FANCL-like n=1 Tax=Telopea speciosissima TaxID=54955 RepID=UPI001CC6E372|nr:E3 ubiquitin-protein ligase FANCL-like [Telopea speciosissima]
MALSSSFNRSIYSEVEEVGWEHLVRLGEDLTSLSFRILDKKGHMHTMEIRLPPNYPKCPPSISADVPYLFELKWSTKSRLKDVVHQFLEEFWSTLENIDRVLWVVDPRQPSRATSYRKINLGNDCCIVLSINSYDPRSLPECRFLGPDSIVDSMRKKWRSNGKRWYEGEGTILQNLQ